MKFIFLNILILFILNHSCLTYSTSQRKFRNFLINEVFNNRPVDRRAIENSEEYDDSYTKHSPESSWTGRWFPERTPSMRYHDFRHKPSKSSQDSLADMKKMISHTCDDGKTNLTVDWSGNNINHTCFSPSFRFIPDFNLPVILEEQKIPAAYKANHVCMNKKIEYTVDLPTFGAHRPAWPRYGEYKFVPKQRWLHSLEHGAVVMLYHPCAQPNLVKELRNMVRRCLFRHVITPYTLLPLDRPFALLTWGYALRMSAPDEDTVQTFIRQHALQGPEQLSEDGQYDSLLIHPAEVISDEEDSELCP